MSTLTRRQFGRSLCGLPFRLAAAEEFQGMTWNEPAVVAKAYLATAGSTATT